MNDTLKIFLKHPAGIIGLTLLALVCIAAALAPVVYPASPWQIAGVPFAHPGEGGMWLGTDTLGRDVASSVIHGARVSLLIGVASTLAALLIGVTLGALAGFAGGAVDLAIVRVTEIFQTIPAFVLAILLVAILTPSLGTIILTIGLVSWPPQVDGSKASVEPLLRAELSGRRHRLKAGQDLHPFDSLNLPTGAEPMPSNPTSLIASRSR